MSWWTLASVGLSIFGGLRQSSLAKKGGQAGYNQGLFNAQQANYFAQLNSGAHMEAAHINAAMASEIANLNADFIERTGKRNLRLYGIQTEEEMRRHERAEKMHAGQIRAMQSGTGIQTNTGSNLYFLNDQINEGLNQRHFLATKHFETKKAMKENTADQAWVTRETGRLQAESIMANGAISADMALAQGQYQSQQYMNQANAALAQGNAASNDALWGTLGTIGKWGLTGFEGVDKLKNIFSLSSVSQSAAPPTLISSSTRPAPIIGTGAWADKFASDFMVGH